LGRDGSPPEKNPRVFVYASAPGKGLLTTLQLWRQMHRAHPLMRPLRLRIVLPGLSYDLVPQVAETDGVEFVGAPSIAEYRRELAAAAGLFYVCDTQETFGNVAALVEKFGGRAHVLARFGKCGLEEALVDGGRYVTEDVDQFQRRFLAALAEPPRPAVVRDLSAAAVLPMWERALGLAS
jgi:hypothetical protein